MRASACTSLSLPQFFDSILDIHVLTARSTIGGYHGLVGIGFRKRLRGSGLEFGQCETAR